MYDDIYSLKIGDRFMEDTYPEIWEVIGFEPDEDFGKICTAKCVYAPEPEAHKLDDITHWGYSEKAYSPCIYKVD